MKTHFSLHGMRLAGAVMVLLIALILFFSRSSFSASTGHTPPPAANGAPQAGVVDGRVTPDAIPDRIAYMMMLNFIGGMRNQPGGTAYSLALGYLEDIGLAEADANAVIIIAGEFYTERENLVRQAREIIGPENSNPSNRSSSARLHLAALQEDKEALVARTVASLPTRLSLGGLLTIQQHIKQRVKPNIKIRSASN